MDDLTYLDGAAARGVLDGHLHHDVIESLLGGGIWVSEATTWMLGLIHLGLIDPLEALGLVVAAVEVSPVDVHRIAIRRLA